MFDDMSEPAMLQVIPAVTEKPDVPAFPATEVGWVSFQAKTTTFTDKASEACTAHQDIWTCSDGF